MHDGQPTAQEVLQEIRTRPYIRIAAMGGGHLSLWKRLTLLYRLYVRTREAILLTEGAAAERQSEAARRAFSLDGGDLGN